MNNNFRGFTHWFIIILASSAIIFTSFFLLKSPLKITTSPNQDSPDECSVCGPQGIHNIEGKTCPFGYICKVGLTTSASYCVKPEDSVTKCEEEFRENIDLESNGSSATTNWKTFSSQIIPIEFKTPPEWGVEEEKIVGAYDRLIITTSSPDFIQKNYLPSQGFQIIFGLLYLDLTGNEKPVRFDSYERFRELGGIASRDDDNEKIVTINGITWLKYPASAYTLYGKNPLSARITSTEDQQSVAETLFNQILSTFQFLN